ncbi:unnamed protein product [Rhizophagus irregularis]|nr:unnamed protein product [Rhizophagus irregularis]
MIEQQFSKNKKTKNNSNNLPTTVSPNDEILDNNQIDNANNIYNTVNYRDISKEYRKSVDKKQIDYMQNELIKFGTINIRSFNEDKRDCIIELMDELNVHVMGLAETNFSNKKKGRYIMGQVDNVQNMLDTLVKRPIEPRGVIQVYLHASANKDKKALLSLHQDIIKVVKDAKTRKMAVICMGDFNIGYHKYKNPHLASNKWKHVIFDNLQKEGLMDTAVLHMDDLEKFYTFNPHPNSGDLKSRIDYIWSTLELEQHIIATSTVEVDYDITDHNFLMITLEKKKLINPYSMANNYKKKIRTKYLINDMDETGVYSWEEYKNSSKRFVHSDESNKVNNAIANEQLDRTWDQIKKVMSSLIKTHIKTKDVYNKNQWKSNVPPKIADINFIGRILMNLKINKNKIDDQSYNPVKDFQYENIMEYDKWIDIETHIIDIIRKYNINFIWDHIVPEYKNYVEILMILKNVKSEVKKLHNREVKQQTAKQIKEAVERRNVNYKVDQKQMIISILNKQRTYISIEKIYQKGDMIEKLISDPKEVKEATVQHFLSKRKVSASIGIDLGSLWIGPFDRYRLRYRPRFFWIGPFDRYRLRFFVSTSVLCGLDSLIGIGFGSFELDSLICIDLGIDLDSLWIGLFDRYRPRFFVSASVLCVLDSLIGIDLDPLWIGLFDRYRLRFFVSASVLCGLGSLIGIDLDPLWIGLFDRYRLRFFVLASVPCGLDSDRFINVNLQP